ncbi:MAG: glycosyltransferase family 2 protein [Aliiglaciecola sp.]|uniref:glycosyltransferase family 2 protein n=1 Tax=Aliiglaciecola sp. TaxID=1872441 RepID=UPI0032977CB7
MNLKKFFRFRFSVYLSCRKASKYLFWLWILINKCIRKRKPYRVKLVAIAKNEACYLPEWLAHHQYFGFDHISVYVNNTTDNTSNIVRKLSSVKHIEFCDGDEYFQPDINVPQTHIYQHELKRSRKQGYSHVMFLDIDEFWTPKDLKTTIHDFLKQKTTDVVCFEWLNRTNEVKPFLPTIEKKIEGIKGNHVKSLVSTDVLLEAINPHNILGYKIKHQLADGSRFHVDENNFAKISPEEIKSPLKDIFILHRMFRSQEEYVALLLRGRPIQNRPYADIFKTNRSGYIPRKPKVSVSFDVKVLTKYQWFIENFVANYKLHEEIELGRRFVIEKREQVSQIIADSPFEVLPILSKIFTRVTLPDVVAALKAKQNNCKTND